MVQHHTRRQGLSIQNSTPINIEGPTLLHELVPLSSDVSAIDFLEHGFKRRKFSYQKLHALSDLLARRIVELTATLESASAIIPVLLPQCAELYIVMLAILKAGKAFCPLNLDVPEERLKFILTDVSADLLITNTGLLGRLHPMQGLRTICVDHELLHVSEDSTTVLPFVDTSDLAYVLYTSGSTGLPKAVSVSHRAVTQSLLAHDRHIPAFARFLQFAAPTFDVSIFEIFFPWFRGRTLVGRSRTQMLEDLPATIKILEADAAELTPTVAGNLLQGRASVPGLKLLLTIGEMLTQHVVKEYGDSATRNGILWAMYGPTEAAIHCTLQAQFAASSSIGNIGYPLDTVSTFIMGTCSSVAGTPNLTILPWGDEGELVLGGHQIAEEYLNRPELTATSFINHSEYGRLYRTGDRARFCDNGTIECLGRIVTGQVKLRGQRIELGEVEQIIMKVEGCRMAIATVVDDALVAFCATGSHTVSRQEVLRVCKRWLPGFMVPSDVYMVPSMPQLPSGKIDKRRLESEYSDSRQNHENTYVQPEDQAALTILRVVQDCVGHKLSLDSDLAATGLDSLRAIRVASRLRAKGYDLGAVDVLSSETLSHLIVACKDVPLLNGDVQSLSQFSVQDVDLMDSGLTSDIDFITPCTPLQEAMLAETLTRPSMYCNWVELELAEPRSYDDIYMAISSLARENAVLRSGFCAVTNGSGSFAQVTWKELQETQFERVLTFQKSYTIETAQALLRPFAVQVQGDNLDRPRILLQLHHALYDGWSIDLLMIDLDKLLQGLGPTLRPQFRDISRYYMQRQHAPAVETDKRYWADLLRDYRPTTLVNYNGELRNTEGLQSLRGRSSVNPQMLFKQARELAVNPQVFFQAATGYILGLYTGCPDVVFGNVTSGRTIPVNGIEDVIGPCIASLPFRLDFKDLPTVYDVLRKTQDLNRESLRHCALPLRDIARAANAQPGARMFDVLYVWQQSLSSRSNSTRLANVVDSADSLEFNLTLEFEPCNDFISFRATFDPSILPEKQVQILLHQIDEVVKTFSNDLSCTMVDVGRCFSMSSLSIANPEYRRGSDNISLSHAVQNWASVSPNKEAVIFGQVSGDAMRVKDTLTYSRLNSRANQLARLLSQQGVGQNQLVCIMMEKSVDLYVAILSVLKLGSGYLPLILETPIDRVGAILRDAQVAACITEPAGLQSIREHFSGTTIDLHSTDLSVYPTHDLNIPYDGSHLAYAVYTSGSTGTPKGVLVTQQNLMSNLEFLSGLYPASNDSRILQSCSQAFDVSVFEIFYAWHVGISLCTATKEDLFRDLEGSINDLGATHLSLTPTVAALINPNNVPRVEFLVTAGEALTEHVRRQWAGRGLYQGYGPSETTNICTLRPSVTSTDLISNIGAPFENTSAFVMDPSSDAILPRGALGELCFGGEQVFRGYLNRPDLNAAKLINISPYGRIYRSGDMGRLLPDNCILSAGRFDDQVKIRGQRVELGEITSLMLNESEVEDCATLILLNQSQIKTLVNFWIPKNRSNKHFTVLDAEALRPSVLRLFETLSRRLPAYMVPSYVVPVSGIPRTTQSKIDKRMLQTTFIALNSTALTHSAPKHATIDETNGGTHERVPAQSDWEASVANILARVLQVNVEVIQQSSSFFNLGLDSISAIRFCNTLRRAGLGDFTIAEVLGNPTISYLSATRADRAALPKAPSTHLKRLQNIFTAHQISEIGSLFKDSDLQVENIYPCTPLQEAMLTSGALSETAYSNTMIFNVNGDLARLQECWKLAHSRHEILRTSLVPSDHPRYAFAQVVLKNIDLEWSQVDTLHDIHHHMSKVLADLLASHRPPLHLAICKAESSTKIVFSCHHALYDGIAITTLLEEIQQIYLGHRPSSAVPFDLYLRHMISQDVAAADQFWLRRFAGFEPTYFPDVTGKVHKAAAVSKSIRRSLQMPLGVVRAASQRDSVSVLATIQAAWAKLLHFYTGMDDICFGNVVSGRALPEDGLDRLVAPCFNTLPVRVQFDFSRPNSNLVELLHMLNVESVPHQLSALRRIQGATLTAGGRLFDTLVILQQPSKALDNAIWTLKEDIGEMDMPVICEVHQDDLNDSFVLTLHYNTGLLSDKDAQMVAEAFDCNLAALVHHTSATANDSIGFSSNIRAESNMSCKKLPTDSELLHKAFEQNATSDQSRTIALDFLHADGRRTIWSYWKLNLIANHIACLLAQHGVGVEDIVPLHIEKSPMFYASVLGTLKAGAAFTPIHPELPEARKDLMFKELNAKVILCTETSPDLAKQTSAAILNIESLQSECLDFCADPKIANLTGSSMAYCLYTSGSTGAPKAVSMEHRSPVQTVESSRSLVPSNSSSRLLQYAAITFDMCYYDCFLAWTLGFTICTAEQHTMFNDLPHTINLLDVTLLDLTPSVAASFSREQVPGVQWLYCIGEAMSTDVAKEWEGACVNSYGPTEAAFCTTMFPVSGDVKTSVIGKPYPTTSFAVYSAQGKQPLPTLSIGELYIGGGQLARGYLGRPELTNERFVTRSNQRFYKSGDIVRMLSNGDFEFIGRTDDQVKIRGLRVELGEINHVLQNCDTRITSVTTQIMKKDGRSKEQLVAFLTTSGKLNGSEQTVLRKDVVQAAKNQLPVYMVPHFYIFIDSIPRSMAGKVDKKALQQNFEAAHTANGITDATHNDHKWTDVELAIQDVFSQLSKTPKDNILPDTSIYQLGLDSISAVQVATALRKRAYNVRASDVMRFANCIDLAKSLSQVTPTTSHRNEQFNLDVFDRKHRAVILKSYGLDTNEVEAIRPCTPLQQGMISQFIANDGSVYYNYVRLHLRRTDIDISRLRNAWAMTMSRHPILRTGFIQITDEQSSFAMVHYTSNSVSLPWSVRDSSDTEAATKRLGSLQRKALTQLHQPMWDIQLIPADGGLFLDLSMFHALFDAHSLQLIFDDVATLYEDESRVGTLSLDSVISELLYRNKDEQESTENFWIDQGKKAVASRFPNMTTLRYCPEPSVILTKSSSLHVAEIEEGCRAANITLQAAGIASWSSILSAYTGEPSVTIGVVLSGRTSETARRAVFPCINTVPFSCTITDDKTEVLQSVMALNAELHQHQFAPLNKIQKLMGTSNESLFDSLFAFQKTSRDSQEKELWTVSREHATTEYPISIELELREAVLQYRLTYMPHLIPSEQASIILQQLDNIMRSFILPGSIAASDPVKERSLYSITEAKEPTLPSEVRLLHEFVEFSARQHPNRIAFEFASSIQAHTLTCKKWTYRELDTESNKIAHLLLSYHVQPGELVGVCFDKCPEASFAMLGVLKAGCAFVAIDPSAPSARQAFIVEDSGALTVLSMSAQSGKFRDNVSVPVLDLDRVVTSGFQSSKPCLEREITPQDRSYCLYTSGTTGTPKGCELTHENAVQAMLAFQRLFAGHWNETSRWLQFASFHFDVSVLEQYWSWSVGICVVSAPRDLIFEDIANSIRTLDITHIDLTPSLAQILHPDDVPSLCKGVFITGGESLKQEILDVWGPKSVIYNGYGPTEATIGCTMYPRVPSNGKPSNIGSQFDNVGSYVLKPGTDIPVLRGGVGELCVSGKLVGKGYLNRPELTVERFAYLDRFKERVYRTGDLVRILHDGTFDFLGRADDQVKLRGQRLEIGEINSVIKQSARDFADVATLVLKHPKQQKEQLVSFVVIGNKSHREPEVLHIEASKLAVAKDACHEKLPPYMVPTHFIPLASMPLNVNNKADGKRLKHVYETMSSNDLQRLSATWDRLDDSWSTQDEKFRRVLAEALSVDEKAIGKNTSFYELGMDSISVIGVSRALKRADFLQATVAALMRHPTIGRLTKVLSTAESTDNTRKSLIAAQQNISAAQHRLRRTVARSLGVKPQDIEVLAPCTPLQQGMIARYLDSNDGLYFNNFTLELHKDINISQLRLAWSTVFNNTQILRTAFVNTDDGYVQAVRQGIALPWTAHHFEYAKGLDSVHNVRQCWLEANRNDLNRPFELHLIGPSGAQVLLVHIFHGLYDGNSLELLFDGVRKLYEGPQPDTIVVPTFHEALPHGPLRIAEGAKQFWEDHLMGPEARPRTSLSQKPTQNTVMVTRDFHSIPGYDLLRKKLNVTAQAIAQACWVHVLQQYVHAPIATGMIVSGRNLDLELANQIIGPLFNTIPYQQHTRNGDTWASIIARAHDFNIAALPYQHTPLRDIMKWCKRNANQPIFDTLFVYQVSQANDEKWKSNAVWTLLDSDAVADYPLAFEIEQRRDNDFRLVLVAQGQFLSEEASNEILDRFEDALASALADSSSTLEPSIHQDEVAISGAVDTARDPAGLNGLEEFEWTEDAFKIQEEIATLAGVDSVAIHESTSIFELGLDSIDAIKLSSRLRMRGVNIPVSGIMRGLTVKNMLGEISSHQTTNDQSDIIPTFDSHKKQLRNYVGQCGIQLGLIDDVLPLTPLQEAMVAGMLASDYTRYYNFDVAELAPDTDIGKLRHAWNTVIKSSPILRTTFFEIDDAQIDGSYAQVVIKQEALDLPIELKVFDGTDKPNFAAIFENLRRAAVHPKALDPQVKIMFLETSKGKYQVLSIAHALYDGWSLGLLHEDVHAAYQGLYTSRPSYEPALAEILSAPRSDAADFWQDYLTGSIPSLLPRRSIESTDLQKIHRMERKSEVGLPVITNFAKRSNVSLQTLCQTAFALTLASYVASLDVTFGSVISGREDDGRSQLLFPTMNTVAIRTVLHGSLQEMIRYVQDNFNNIKQWQHFPLRNATSLASAQGRLFDSLFIFQRSTEQNPSTDKKLYNSVEGQSDIDYPICVEMEVVDHEMIWRCAVKEEVLSVEEVVTLLDRLDQVLRAIIERPDSPTINSTIDGTSVCGLPAFENKDAYAPDNKNEEEQSQPSSNEPLSPTASKIRQTLALVSQTPEAEIERGMSIFHVGLDSISAIKVSSILRKQGIILSVGEMLKAGTVEKMADMVATRTASDQAIGHKPTAEQVLQGFNRESILKQANLAESQVDQVLPATSGQVYMLSMWLNTNGSNFYPEFIYNVNGSVDLETLQKSWRTLIAANPILRTHLVATDQSGYPYAQVVLKDVEALLSEVVDQDAMTMTPSIVKVASRHPWTHLFVSQSKTGWTARLRIHHALYDGVSLPLLMQQFQDLCNGSHMSTPDRVMEEYAVVAHAASAPLRQRTFWTKYLEGAKLHQRSKVSVAPASTTEIFEPGFLRTSNLEAVARQHGISVQAIFLAAYTKTRAVVAKLAEDEDTVIGIYLANRSLPIDNLSTAAIPTVNLLPLRIRSPLRIAILDSAAQIQKDLLDISGPVHATASLYEISKWTGVTIDTFVNFLSLPNNKNEDEDSSTENGSVKISQKQGWHNAVSRVSTREYSEWEAPKELINKPVNAAYLHAIDIEATVCNGNLDIGVFAPSQMLSLEAGESLMGALRKELGKLG